MRQYALRWFGLPKGNEFPFPFRHRGAMPENIEIAVVSPELEEDVFWAVPLIEYFLDKIFALV